MTKNFEYYIDLLTIHWDYIVRVFIVLFVCAA